MHMASIANLFYVLPLAMLPQTQTCANAGQDSISQLAEIVSVLGSITETEAKLMHDTRPNNQQLLNFPKMRKQKQKPWTQVLTRKVANGRITPTSFGRSYECLLDGLLRWSPADCYNSLQILMHPFFDVMKASGHKSWQLKQNLTNEEVAVIGDTMGLTPPTVLKQSRSRDLSAANTPECADTNMSASTCLALRPRMQALDVCLNERVDHHQHRLKPAQPHTQQSSVRLVSKWQEEQLQFRCNQDYEYFVVPELAKSGEVGNKVTLRNGSKSADNQYSMALQRRYPNRKLP